MHSAVVGIGSSTGEGERIGKPVVVYSRIKYSVGIARSAGGRAVVVARPSPPDDIPDLNGDCTWNVTGAALPDANVSRRRTSDLKCCRKQGNGPECPEET